MERFKIGEVVVFELHVGMPQALNRKLRDIADELTTTGEVPQRGPDNRLI